MTKNFTGVIYILFFFSGTAGLIYEIVWTRMLVLVFGNTTHSVVAVISIFLGGLAAGSFLFGKRTDKLSADRLLRLYSLLEFGVGASAILSIPLLEALIPVYSLFSDGTSVTVSLLFIKFALSALILLVPTVLMGATLPTLVSFAELQKKDSGKNVSLLYAVNTFGAILGVLAGAFVLIELVGLNGTLLLAAFLNFVIGGVARVLRIEDDSRMAGRSLTQPGPGVVTSRDTLILVAYALAGLTAIAYQVLWTRMLTPRTGTFIYAFAGLLATYLSGIAIGSWIYHRFLAHNRIRNVVFAFSQLGIGISALGSVYVASINFNLSDQLTIFWVFLPATIFMGIAFPAVVLLLSGSERTGNRVGVVYASNTIGSIVGAFFGSFFLLPVLGVTRSIMVLAVVNLTMAIVLFAIQRKEISRGYLISFISSIFALVVLVVISIVWRADRLYEHTTQKKLNEVRVPGVRYQFKEDEVASVLGYNKGEGKDQNLLIDGVPTTTKVVETKLMAHLPLALHPSPERVLVIAFGMGTTFRSALLHDVWVDAVEVCPSVPEMFPLFYADAAEVRKNPRGRIIINDGRNYVLLTSRYYDVVTIDPPPPFNAAGTTVLYAREFYERITEKLKPGGLVCQWLLLEAREDDIAMAMRSFVEVFPHMQIFRSVGETKGIFMIGSQSPLHFDELRVDSVFRAPAVQKDLAEVNRVITAAELWGSYLGERESFLEGLDNVAPVTDNHPRTEYFLLRHNFTDVPEASVLRLLRPASEPPGDP